jgi:hypothetical protein
LAGVFVIHAIMARIIGKKMIYLNCVPFGDTPVYKRFGEADDPDLRLRQAVPAQIAI